jgi:hypothetical protein
VASIQRHVTKEGTTKYIAVFELGIDPATGRRRQPKRTFATRKEAQRACVAHEHERATGTYVERSRLTVADMLNHWYQGKVQENCKPKTLLAYRTKIDGHLVPRIGHIRAQDLTPLMLSHLYAAMRQEGVGATTLRMAHICLGGAIREQVRLGTLMRDVATPVKVARPPQREMDYWSREESTCFLKLAGQPDVTTATSSLP